MLPRAYDEPGGEVPKIGEGRVFEPLRGSRAAEHRSMKPNDETIRRSFT